MKKLFVRKAVAAIAASALLVMAAGCGSNSAASSAPAQSEPAAGEEAAQEDAPAAAAGEIKMALVAGNSGGTFWAPIEENFVARCEEKGWKGTYMAPAGAEGGTADIQQLCDTALTQGYNVIAAVMNDNDVFEDFRTRAAEQGVLVLGFNCNPGEDIVPAVVGIDSYNSGYQQGEKIAEFAEERGLDCIRYISACTSPINAMK